MNYTYLFLFLIFILIFFIIIRIFNNKRKIINDLIYENSENNPKLNTYCHEQHIRRLIKYRESNYKGIYFYLGAKGGLYYYSKTGVRIYV